MYIRCAETLGIDNMGASVYCVYLRRTRRLDSYFVCHPERIRWIWSGRVTLKIRALSSVGLEHLPYKQGVGGSSPSAPTPPSPWELRFLGAILFIRS